MDKIMQILGFVAPLILIAAYFVAQAWSASSKSGVIDKNVKIANLEADLALVKNDRGRFHDLWTSTNAKLADEKVKSSKAFDDLAMVIVDRNAIEAKYIVALADLADTKFELSRWREWHSKSPAATEPTIEAKGIDDEPRFVPADR